MTTPEPYPPHTPPAHLNEAEDDRFAGRKIREIRKLRGLSQQQLADLVDVSRPLITMYESGERALIDRRLLYATAEALGVSVGDLTGHAQDKVAPANAAFHAAIPRIEAALMAAGHSTVPGRPRTPDQLTADVEGALRLRANSDLATFGRVVPSLITELHQATHTAESERQRRQVWAALGWLAFGVALAVKSMGYPSLAWVAATTCETAVGADDASTADSAAVAYARSQIMLATPGTVSAAHAHAVDWLNRLTPRADPDFEVYGMLHLQAALSACAAGTDPGDHLAEAVALAPRGNGSPYLLHFGPANVGVWSMSIALEQHEGGRAVGLAANVNPDDLPAAERLARYYVEWGRGHALENQYGDALGALLQAEHAAPQLVRGLPVVKEITGYMLRNARRELVTGRLGQFAGRVGAVPA